MHCQRNILPVLQRNRAALKIQSAWRRYNAMIELELLCINQEAAIAIQKTWRGFYQQILFACKVDAIVRIQALVRGYRVRRNAMLCEQAAISIQRIWRGFSAQLLVQLDYIDITTVQSIVRRRLAVLESKRRMNSIVVLQRNIRRVLAQRTVSEMRYAHRRMVERTAAAITCQVSMSCNECIVISC